MYEIRKLIHNTFQMKKAIIIFVRNPELGKVKTRLASEIGEFHALGIYKELLQYTHDITVGLNCDKFVYYADYINDNDIWENQLYKKEVQQGENLGQRMELAFTELFSKSYEKLGVIGSDCPQLTNSLLQEAFDKLESHDAVIGPSVDGGYYFLGLNHLIKVLFHDKSWSTNTVLAETQKDLVTLKKTCYVLPVLQDIDRKEDLATLNLA